MRSILRWLGRIAFLVFLACGAVWSVLSAIGGLGDASWATLTVGGAVVVAVVVGLDFFVAYLFASDIRGLLRRWFGGTGADDK